MSYRVISLTRPHQWLYAKLFGYFWRPCPICGRNFGGQEVGAKTADIPRDGYWALGSVICRTCTRKDLGWP